VFRRSPSADRSSVLPELILSSFSRSVQQVNKQRQKKIRNKEKKPRLKIRKENANNYSFLSLSLFFFVRLAAFFSLFSASF